MYVAAVRADGFVETIKRLDDPVNAARFVELGDFEKCVSRWRLVEPGAYRVLLHGGTMSSQWTVIVSNGKESMRMRIPKRF